MALFRVLESIATKCSQRKQLTDAEKSVIEKLEDIANLIQESNSDVCDRVRGFAGKFAGGMPPLVNEILNFLRQTSPYQERPESSPTGAEQYQNNIYGLLILSFLITLGKRVQFMLVFIFGDGTFVHAPGRGRKVTYGYLTNPYFKKHFIGSRSYL